MTEYLDRDFARDAQLVAEGLNDHQHRYPLARISAERESHIAEIKRLTEALEVARLTRKALR